MENLWKKESNGAGAQYVDLFAFQLGENREEERIYVFSAGEKFNQFSKKCQKRGDDCYRTQKWRKAMDAYNKSLCFAEASKNVSIIYFNRTLCFFRMNMFENALADIQIAMNSNLPTRLVPKLNRLKHQCRKLLEAIQKSPEVVPNLSYEANEHHPCLANVVHIKYNETFGRHLVATADIPVGKTVLVAKSFASATIIKKQMHCHTCRRKKMNFIPCKYCSDVMFCNEDCANRNNSHKMECRTCYHQIKDIGLKLIVQTILVAIDIFPNIENLIAFVEEVTKDKRYDNVPTTSSDASSQYGIFLKLAPLLKSESVHNAAYDAFNSITSMPKVMRLFDTKAKQRFLMHLVLHHTIVIPYNVFGYENPCIAQDIFDVLSLANHSCAPNLDPLLGQTGHVIHCESVRPIKKEEQLFISYSSCKNDEPTKQRRKYFKKHWGFTCNCEKCEPKVTKTNN